MNVCRACLKTVAKNTLFSILEPCNVLKINITQMLVECCSVKINEELYENFKICSKCLKLLHLFYEFKQKIQKNLKLLKNFQSKNGNLKQAELNCLIKIEKYDFDSELSEDISSLVKVEPEDPKENTDAFKLTIKYSCQICGRQFSKQSGLNKHIKARHLLPKKKQEFTCTICEKRFAARYGLQRHLRTVHEKERAFRCDKCPKCYSTNYALQAHIKVSHLNQGYECKICGRSFYNKTTLDYHVERKHPNGELHYYRRRERKYGQNIGKLRRPSTKTDKIYPYLCQQCGKGFPHAYHLRYHQLKHENKRPFECKFCKKKFFSPAVLTQHMRIHLNVRLYKCQFCQKSFIQTQQLTNHIIQHTGEKPFQCDICKKCFANKTNRDAHRRIHTGERPYKCKYCVKAFYDGSTLWKHQKKNHENIENSNK